MTPVAAADQTTGVTLALPPGHDIAEIKGDLMLPTYPPGTLVVVNRSVRRLTGEGLYFVHDGLGEVCRRVSPGAKHGDWMVYQDNKNYSSYEAPVDKIAVAGRIVGIFRPV